MLHTLSWQRQKMQIIPVPWWKYSILILRPFPSASLHVSALEFCCPCICFKRLCFVSLHFKFMVFLISFSTSFFSLKYKVNAASTRPVMTKLFLLAVSSVSSLKFVHYARKHIQFIPMRFCASSGAELILIIIIIIIMCLPNVL